MKALKWLVLGLAVALVAVILLVRIGGRPEPQFPATSESVADTQSLVGQTDVGGAAVKWPHASRPRNTAPTPGSPQTDAPQVGGVSGDVVRLKPNRTLASVNGVAITLKDLMPLPPERAGEEQTISTERYEFLLNRAIEREVTFQAARNQGVELTEAQQKRLEDLRARSEQVESGVFDTVQQNPANVEFEQRDAIGLLLQAALAEKAGVPSPHVTTAQVQAYYQEHQAEYGVLPADPVEREAVWAKIDQTIRLKLAPGLQAEYQQRLQEFIAQLESAAKVDRSSH